MMELKIISMTPAEQIYLCSQSSQLEGQTGCIGHLQGVFRGGQNFHTTWFDHRGDYKTDAFKAELDEIINILREENDSGLLFSRESMTKFCQKHSEAELEGNYCAEYGFKVQTHQHTYMLRCNPDYGYYNFYLYAYVARLLNYHMKKAEQGIRFIDPNYKELFRIPDGDAIRILHSDGTHSDCTCRYIDDYHVEIGGGWNSLLHICQFAERVERNGDTIIPLRSSLPVQCYSVLPSTGELIILTRGESGYVPSDMSVGGKSGREAADLINTTAGITKAQEAAMLAGSMFGWAVPAADPKKYDQKGQPIQSRRKDRGDAR